MSAQSIPSFLVRISIDSKRLVVGGLADDQWCYFAWYTCTLISAWLAVISFSYIYGLRLTHIQQGIFLIDDDTKSVLDIP